MKDILSQFTAKLVPLRVAYWIILRIWERFLADKSIKNTTLDDISIMDILKLLEKRFNR